MSNEAGLVKVVVNRRTWYRGQGATNSYLLAPFCDDHKNEQLCCMGFAARTLGVSDANIRHIKTWQDLANEMSRRGYEIPELMHRALGDPYEKLSLLYNKNDEQMISDERREEELIELGLNIGIQFEFVDAVE